MKKFILTAAVILSSFSVFLQNDVTTYYLIRHAEKNRTDKTNKNPNLNEKGLERAQNWATVFSNIHFDMVYSTNYNRTKQTAKATAIAKDLEVVFYNPRKMYDIPFQKATKGKTILIVGHSNTTAVFANKILGEEKYPQIDDTNNSNLYIITVTNNLKTGVLLKIDLK